MINSKWGKNNVDELFELFIVHHTPEWRRINNGDNYFCDLECSTCKCENFCSSPEMTGNWYFEDDELEQYKLDNPEYFL